jgi:hypothetical protein
VQWLGRVPDTRTSVSVQDDTQAADNYPVNYAAQAVRAHTACQEPRECQSCTLSPACPCNAFLQALGLKFSV